MPVLLIIMMCMSPLPGLAVTVTNLYEAEVPVADQTANGRSAGIQAAFIQVMVKLTGSRNAASIYGVSELQQRAVQFVQQYEYRGVEDAKTGQVRPRLWVRFDAGAIDNGMREYNIPVWSQERPSTLLWLVVRDGLGQRFASLDEDSRYFTVLREQARARGISFITPLQDLQDAAAIRSSDIIGGLEAPLQQASARYHPDAILAGSLIGDPQGLWEGRWTLIIQGQNAGGWSSTGESIDLVLSEGIDYLADNLATRFAQTQGYAGESTQEISVTGIGSFAGYAETLRYLESLNFVSSVDVTDITPGRVVYRLTTRGDASTLAQALALGRVLQPSGVGGEYQLLR